MRTLAVISRKGGVGKTTLSVNLAVSAWRAGLKTVLADLDAQRSAALWGRARVETGPAVVATTVGKLFPMWCAAENSGCDLMVLAAPAGDHEDMLPAIRLADLCVLVCRPNSFDVDALRHSIDLVRNLDKPSLVVLNQAPSRRQGHELESVCTAAADLRASGVRLAEVGLRYRAAFPASAARGMSIGELDASSPGAREIAGVWEQIWSMIGDGRPAPLPGCLPAGPAIVRELGITLGA